MDQVHQAGDRHAKRVYRRMVTAKKMNAHEAETELRTMEAVLATLEGIAEPGPFPSLA